MQAEGDAKIATSANVMSGKTLISGVNSDQMQKLTRKE